MVNKHKQKKKKPFKIYGKKLNALIKKKFQKFVKQEKKENGEGTSALSRNADFR